MAREGNQQVTSCIYQGVVDAIAGMTVNDALQAVSDAGLDVVDDFALAKQIVLKHRQARDNDSARILISQLVEKYDDDQQAVSYCIKMYHRTQGFSEALSLVAEHLEFIDRESVDSVRLVAADCHFRLGDLDAAAEILGELKDVRFVGVEAHIYQRLYRTIGVKQGEVFINPEVYAIEEAFGEGRNDDGVLLFNQLQDKYGGNNIISGGTALQRAEGAKYADMFNDFMQLSAPKQVILLTDSIAMPREEQNLAAEETYPFVAQKQLQNDGLEDIALLPDCLRGRTVVSLHEEILARLEEGEQSYDGALIQLGIVDCAPRVFKPATIAKVRTALGQSSADKLIEIAHNYRKYVERPRHESPYVPIVEFENRIRSVIRLARDNFGCRFIGIMTIVTPSRFGKKMSGAPLAENVSDYNAVISKICREERTVCLDADSYIWSQEDAVSCFTNDNYHYNAVGHRHIGQMLAKQLGKFGL